MCYNIFLVIKLYDEVFIIMKIKNFLLILLSGITLGCGYYTNVPAQYHIVQSADTSLTGEVAYSFTGTSYTYTVKNPKLMLEGEPGSIGLTFDTLTIEYTPESVAQKLPPVTILTTFRLGSSHFRDGSGNLIKGTGVEEIPVISSKVAAYGSSQLEIIPQISARVSLKGLDDAGFPVDITFGVPINFIKAGSK